MRKLWIRLPNRLCVYSMTGRKLKGSVSVVIALTLTLMLSFSMALIESARENTLLLKADIVFDAGVQGVMAQYSAALWEKYDLLYVDSGDSGVQAAKGHISTQLADIIEKNLAYDTGGWLALDYVGVEISELLLATDFSGKDFYLQAVDAAAASTGLSYIELALRWFDKTEETYNMGDFLQEETQRVSDSIEEVNGTEVVTESVWEENEEGERVLVEETECVNIENPLDRIWEAGVLLHQVTEGSDSISSVEVDRSFLASHRRVAAGTLQDERKEDGIRNKLLFCKYVIDHFGCYTDTAAEKEKMLHCEQEYLLGGKESDRQNMELVTAKLLILREIDNYLMLMQDEVKKLEAHELALAATAALVPWMEPVVYQAILIYWAYEESVKDLQVLFRGEKIPLVKSLSLGAGDEYALGYQEYLLLLLLMQSREKLVMRSIDIVELNMRMKNEAFCMDACLARAQLEGSFCDMYGRKYEITEGIQFY